MLILSLSLVSAIRINEVMPHTNNSLGDEWVEIFNPDSYNLSMVNWKIGDLSSNDTINFNVSANSFLMIADSSIGCSGFNNINCLSLTTIGSGLNDDIESIYLYDNNSILLSTFSWNFSIKNTGNSWSFCNNLWQKASPTPGYENNCTIIVQNLSNSTTTINNLTNQTQKAKISIELEYDSEGYSQDEFGVRVLAHNLEDKTYDLKIFITDNSKTISEIYDKENNEWMSGTYYLAEVFSGPGSPSDDFRLRLKDGNFTGSAEIIARLREFGTSLYIENSRVINFIKKGIETEELQNGDLNEPGNRSANGAIKLIPKNIKSYKSKTQYIKEYSLYGFTLFCLMALILLIKKYKQKNEY